jgi:multidrug efflux pump subunit AcrB
MNGLVRIALERPYTFVVLALLILIIGPLAALRTPTDIFPDIDIPACRPTRCPAASRRRSNAR